MSKFLSTFNKTKTREKNIMAKKLSINGSGPEIGRRIANRIPFETYGALWGTDSYGFNGGHLSGSAYDQWSIDRANICIDYVVYSYSTPILWHTTDGRWVEVHHYFSASTSKHQGRAFMYAYYGNVPDEARTALQVGYGLSSTQAQMLERTKLYGMLPLKEVKGQASRTLAVLYRLGLVEDTGKGYAVVTPKGENAER